MAIKIIDHRTGCTIFFRHIFIPTNADDEELELGI